MATGTGRYDEFVNLVKELRGETGLQRLTMEFGAPNGEVVAANGMVSAEGVASADGCRPAPAPASTSLVLAEALGRLGSYGNDSIDQWDFAFIQASDAVFQKRGVRVKPHVMKGMMDVETGGDGTYPAGRCRPCDGIDCVPACGPMQIKRQYHFHRCPECNWSTVEGQVELATHIIGMTMLERGRDEYDALITTYFPQGDINGTSQKMYVDRVRKLERIMDRDLGGEEPEPEPEPGPHATQEDILNLISNHAPGVYISFGFNQLNEQTNRPIYNYGVGHGLPPGGRWHPGIDIWMPDETPVSCVFGGEVLCVGGSGQNNWGQGCGYFADDDGGIGRVTILTDRTVEVGGRARPVNITYGHMSSANVRVGQVVKDGERIGRSGIGLGWPHVHLDFVVNAPDLNNPQIWLNPGEYHLVDPIPHIQKTMGAPVPKPHPLPYDVPQPAEMDRFATVIVTKDGLPVLQRASMDAPETREPLKQGDDFEAAMQIIGKDGDIFWITSNKNRVPVKGTRTNEWPVD
jgi:murein DD-endopeptidase MepM/ murein hydrolase activator NlpD